MSGRDNTASNKERLLMCYSKRDFDSKMVHSNWMNEMQLPNNIAVISICSKYDEEDQHWFSNLSSHVLNVDFDDVSPESDFGDKYDEMLDDTALSANEFSYYIMRLGRKQQVHALDHEMAFKIVRFIDNHISCDFYVHCSAGLSRSQAIVRYILDTYGDSGFITREDNPCLTPNMHVLRMLKRAKMRLDELR